MEGVQALVDFMRDFERRHARESIATVNILSSGYSVNSFRRSPGAVSEDRYSVGPKPMHRSDSRALAGHASHDVPVTEAIGRAGGASITFRSLR